MIKSKRVVLSCLLLIALWMHPSPAVSDQAKIVSVRPEAFITSNNQKQAALVARQVAGGEILETGTNGRMSLLLPDQMLLKIASESVFVFDPPDSDQEMKIDGTLSKGKVWLRGHKKNQSYNITTPSVTAAIRGTEWYMSVNEAETTTIGVLDGQVEISNEFGRIMLASREMATVRKGYPPVKSAYIVPDNAVNWTLNYHGFWDEKDLNRAGPEIRPMIRQALNAYEKNDLDQGLELLAALQDPYEFTPEWQTLKGFLELVSGNDEMAAVHFARASEIAPDWALPMAQMALMKVVENNIEQAVAYGLKAVAAEPDSSVAMIAMAYCRKAGLNLEEAYEFARKAVSLSPDFDQALLVAARIALEMDDILECRHFLGRIRQDSPIQAEALTLSGYLELRTGHASKALMSFNQAVALDPEASDALVGKGIAHFNLNQVQQGLDSIILATLISPQVSSYQSYLVKAYLENKEYDQAQKTIDRAKRLDPKDPTPHLYESLNLFELHKPGQAILSLDKAMSLNENRAVFRSRYLMDQDSAVLMSNTATLYDTLGFNYSSIQSSARAVDHSPLNPAAYRRLFFSNIYTQSTRPIYQQEMETTKLLAKLLVPPTLNAIIFTPGGLSPYQQLFANTGIDAVISGNYTRRSTLKSNSDGYGGYLSLSGKPDYPVVLSAAVLPSRHATDTKTASPFVSTFSEADIDTLYASTMVKGRISPVLEAFAEVSGTCSGIDSRSASESFTSSVTDMGPYGSFFSNQLSRSNTSSSTDSENLTLDTGMHFEINQTLHALVHFGYGTIDDTAFDKTDSRTSTTIGGSTIETQTYEDVYSSQNRLTVQDEYHILQGSLWKKMDQHFFETGIRFFDGNRTAKNQSFASSSADRSVLSGFFSHQYSLSEAINLNWGLSRDHIRYQSESGIDRQTSLNGYHLGAAWTITPVWTFRTALVRNAPGDGKQRLQRPVAAGFPLMSLNSDEQLCNSDEKNFHLENQTFYSALDFKAKDYPLFSGLEYSRDHGQTSSSDTLLLFNDIKSGMDAHHVRGYFETLITPELSIGLSAVYSDLNVDQPATTVNGYRKRAQASVSYFFPYGLSMRVHGMMEQQNVQTISEKTAIVPEITWHGFKNTFKINIKGKLEKNAMAGIKDRLNEITLNFYWYY